MSENENQGNFGEEKVAEGEKSGNHESEPPVNGNEVSSKDPDGSNAPSELRQDSFTADKSEATLEQNESSTLPIEGESLEQPIKLEETGKPSSVSGSEAPSRYASSIHSTISFARDSLTALVSSIRNQLYDVLNAVVDAFRDEIPLREGGGGTSQMAEEIAGSIVESTVEDAVTVSKDVPRPSSVKWEDISMRHSSVVTIASPSSGSSRAGRPWVLRKTVKLERHNFETFVLFELQSPITDISVYFLLYKYLHCTAVVALLIASLVMSFRTYWFVSLSNWCLTLCAAEALWGTFIVNYYFYNLRTKALREDVYDDDVTVQTNTYVIAHSTSLTVSIATFTVLSTLKKTYYFESPSFVKMVIVVGLMIVKLIVERYPYPFVHVFFSLIFFTLYLTCDSLYVLTLPTSENGGKYLLWDWQDIGKTLTEVCISYAIILGVHIILYVLIMVKKLVSFRKGKVPYRLEKRKKKTRMRGSMFSDADVQAQMKKLEGDDKYYRTKIACQDIFKSIARYEKYTRKGMHTFEWQLSPEADITLYLVIYRLVHVIIFFLTLIRSCFEPDRKRKSTAYYMKWIFYWDHTFLVFSFFQAVFGFVLTFNFYRRRNVELKYFQRSATYVTLPQKFYSAVFSAAFTLSLFLAATSNFFRQPSSVLILGIREYDIVVTINLTLLTIDFILIAVPFKLTFIFVALLIFSINLLMNGMAYMSGIGGRDGKKYIYENLPWGNAERVTINVACLYLLLISIHVLVWILFIFKKNLSIYLKKTKAIRDQLVFTT